jgi:hypothetical protein
MAGRPFTFIVKADTLVIRSAPLESNSILDKRYGRQYLDEGMQALLADVSERLGRAVQQSELRLIDMHEDWHAGKVTLTFSVPRDRARL